MFAILAVLIGVVVAVQSRINGQLSVDLNNGLAAALVSFTTGWLLVTILVLINKKERRGLQEIFAAIKGPTVQMDLFKEVANGKTFPEAFEKIFGMPWKDAAPIIARVIAKERGNS
jgi:hypothetical protein